MRTWEGKEEGGGRGGRKGKGKGKGNKVSLFTCAASACLWRSSCAATSALL